MCIQEHWLWHFQQKYLNDIDPSFKAVAKSVDDNDPISHTHLTRGHGGVAILYKHYLHPKINPMPDGNERVIAVTCESTPRLCIICAYLPCRGTYTTQHFGLWGSRCM